MSAWIRIKAVAHRHYYVLLRSPHRTFDIVLWPLIDVILFGSIGTFIVREDGDGGTLAAAYILSGIVLWHVVYQSQISLSTGFLEETWSRQVLSLMVTPLKEWEYAAGVALFGLVKTLIGVGGVALCAIGFYGFGVTRIGWVLIPIIGVLMLAGWVIALFVISMVLRFGSGAEAFAWGILFAFMPLSGVFYPIEDLPAVFRPISVLLPTTHAFAAGRDVLDGHGTPWGELGLAAITTVLCGAAVVAFLGHMLTTFRRRGYVTRYST